VSDQQSSKNQLPLTHRLRQNATSMDCLSDPYPEILLEAADEIERLQRENRTLRNAGVTAAEREERLREALEYYATHVIDGDVAKEALGPADETAPVHAAFDHSTAWCGLTLTTHMSSTVRPSEATCPSCLKAMRSPEETTTAPPGWCEAGRHTFLPGGSNCIRCGAKNGSDAR